MAAAVKNLFSNTGPTGQRAMERARVEIATARSSGSAGRCRGPQRSLWPGGRGAHPGLVAGRRRRGHREHGFPAGIQAEAGPGPLGADQPDPPAASPLLPDWGKNRTFAMPKGATCALPPPPDYSEDKLGNSTRRRSRSMRPGKTLTPEQTRHRALLVGRPDAVADAARPLDFDRPADPRARQGTALDKSVDVLARLGIAMADAFIGCWTTKFQYDLLAPGHLHPRVIDPKWEPLLITPPFPEYPSGHSTQSGAAAVVLTQFFGENFAFEDATRHARRPEAAQFRELPGGGRRGRHFAALRRHPFPRRDRARPGAGPLHRRLRQRLEDEEIDACARCSRALPGRSAHRLLAPARPLPRTASPSRVCRGNRERRHRQHLRRRMGIHGRRRRRRRSTATTTALPTCCWPAATAPAKFYRNASTRGGALKFEAQTERPRTRQGDRRLSARRRRRRHHRPRAAARRRKCRDARHRRLHVRARQRGLGL